MSLELISNLYIICNFLFGICNLFINVYLIVIFTKYVRKQKKSQNRINNSQQIQIQKNQNEVDLMVRNMHERLNQLRFGTFSNIKSQSQKGSGS